MEKQGLGTLQLREIGRQEGRTPTDAYFVRHCPHSASSSLSVLGLAPDGFALATGNIAKG